ncbi:MAG: DUF4349 domain-containing protein, partial [Acidimicrobiia bacterium]|nr:DUF4349 domain-containing protein [Acidimicrobiia bacterium]
MRRTKTLKLTTTVALLALLVAACGSAEDGATDSTEAVYTTTTAAFATEDGEDRGIAGGSPQASDTLGSGAIAPVVAQTVNIGRDIVFRADLVVAVTDVATAGIEATGIIESLSGFVFGQQTSGGPEAYSVLTFKVFPEDFQKALTRLGSIGKVRTQNISADDVTERIVDLESRINTASASVDRLRALLSEATDISTISQLENQLLERETKLETLRGQLRTLEDAVSLATITLTLTEAQARPSLAVEVTAYPGADDEGQSCPGTGGGIDITEDDEYTLCVTIYNSGDTRLGDLTLTDTILGVELDDMNVVWGELTPILEPGQEVILSAEFVAERDLRTRTRVTATPLDADGVALRGGTVSTVEQFFVNSVDPGGLPGFSDGLA